MSPILEVRDLVKEYPVRGGLLRRQTNTVKAVNGISLTLERGKTLGLVGETGCGKSTVGRCLVNLVAPTSGSVLLDGQDLANMTAHELRAARRRIQLIFQDPYASLDPRQSIASILVEPLRLHKLAQGHENQRISELADLVGLSQSVLEQYPHELSGGQRQRVGIARALALEPEVIVLDEPVSALDVSVQAGVLNLLDELQVRFNLAYVFIAHDLSVVRHISHEVAVMYMGRIIEQVSTDKLYETPLHPYTKALISAVPVPDPRIERTRQRILLEGDLPSPLDLPVGCSFASRCWKSTELCATVPSLVAHDEHFVACHHPEER
jgi:oligopeptide/dipeptide ABC transporter ATP-binding protein